MVRITEKNIDGCGGYAEVFLQLQCPEGKTEEELCTEIQARLRDKKQEYCQEGEFFDTDEIIETVLSEMGISYEGCCIKEVVF